MDESGRRRFLKRAGIAAVPALALNIPNLAAQDAAQPASRVLSHDVRKFGAAGDGKTLDTAAINRAIDEAANSGGGTIYFPAGNYLCYSLHLKSKVALYLEQGATIVAADPTSDASRSYDAAESNKPWEDYQDFGHNHWHNSLIWARGSAMFRSAGRG